MPMTWQEFKDFFQKNLGDSRAFVNSIWSKIKRNSQYQDKSIQDWAAHLKYLQFILIKFDPNSAPEKGTIIWYFQEDLWLSIQLEREQRGQELDSFKEIVKKTVDAKVKAALKPCSYTCNTHQDYFRGSRLAVTKTSTQGQSKKDLRVEKPKRRSQKQKTLAL